MHETLLAPTLHRGKKIDGNCVEGGSDPRTFWAAGSQKSGVAPARFSLFSTVTLTTIGVPISLVAKKFLPPQVMKQERAKVGDIILTFFTCLPQVPGRERRTGGVFPS